MEAYQTLMASFESLTPSFTTPDLHGCLDFYRDLLGFEVTSEYVTEGQLRWVELTSGGVVLMLLAADDETDVHVDAPGVIFYCRVSDVGEIRARLDANDVAVSPIEVTFYGMRECYVRDPDGRQLTLAGPSSPDEPVTIAEL